MSAPSLFRGSHTLTMGIVNVTPDSFSDGGLFLGPANAVRHAVSLVEQGADILDIGGESTRPGAEPVSVEEELSRVQPVLQALLAEVRVPLSIDTRKPEVAEACLAAGAKILNDIGGLRHPEMLTTAAKHNASVVIMHMQGDPKTMQQSPTYSDVVNDVKAWLQERAQAARAAGIKDIALDPGIGFGKTADHNFALLARLDEFVSLGYPVLVGPSRKRFLGTVTGVERPEQRLEGTLAASVACALAGASVLRVHDVAECVRALRVADAIRSARV